MSCVDWKFLTLHVLQILYNYLIIPHLQYGILSWGFFLGRLEKLQKRSVRIITRSKYNAHTDPLFKSLNLLKLKYIFELSVLNLYFKFKHNLLPVYSSNMFTESIRNPHYNLRARGPLELSNPTTVSGEKCLRCYLPNFINNSASEVLDKVNTHSYKGFSLLIKRTKMNSYRINCTVPDCYICSNCPWIYPIFISKFYFVLWCISRLPCSSIVSLIGFSLPIVNFCSRFFSVSVFLFIYCSDLYIFFQPSFVKVR